MGTRYNVLKSIIFSTINKKKYLDWRIEKIKNIDECRSIENLYNLAIKICVKSAFQISDKYEPALPNLILTK